MFWISYDLEIRSSNLSETENTWQNSVSSETERKIRFPQTQYGVEHETQLCTPEMQVIAKQASKPFKAGSSYLPADPNEIMIE